MITVTVGEPNTQKEVPFPKLMVSSTGVIILATASGCGTCLVGNNLYKVGVVSDDWNMNVFQYFHGSITLQNEKP